MLDVLCGREKYVNVIFTKGTEEWNDLIHIIKYIVHNLYNIIPVGTQTFPATKLL